MRAFALKDAADQRERSRRHVAALAISLAVNIALVFALFLLMRAAPQGRLPPSTGSDNALEVRLIDRSVDAPVGPSESAATAQTPAPATASPRERSSRTARSPVEPASHEVARLAVAPAQAAPPLALFNADGSVRIGTDPVEHEQTSGKLASNPRMPDDNPLTRHSSVTYHASKFDRAWVVPKNESLAGELARKATVSHSWRTPWGTQISCVWVIALGGCGWGRPPQATIEELRAMRADPPPPNPSVEP